MQWNPSNQLRVNFRLNQQNNRRPKDGTLVTSATVPRLKIEYQLNKSIFFRFVGQYNSSYRDSLRDTQVMDSLYILKITRGVLVELWRENQIVYRLTFFFLTGLLLELWFFWGMVHLYKNQKGIDLEILKENLMVFL
ncbi:MAG: hypothetical protein Ct9H90mP7_3170 [Candidatus Neomarinimicrobiota bacterium]|nr:MAG: hypothetical protein Ct9H90mP7_3170 [Candidatus Neomarinimicrobiota bacterium]